MLRLSLPAFAERLQQFSEYVPGFCKQILLKLQTADFAQISCFWLLMTLLLYAGCASEFQLFSCDTTSFCLVSCRTAQLFIQL